MDAAAGVCGALPSSLLGWFPSSGHPGRTQWLAVFPQFLILFDQLQIQCEPTTEAVANVPDDLQLIAGALCVISGGGGVMATGHVHWRDVS